MKNSSYRAEPLKLNLTVKINKYFIKNNMMNLYLASLAALGSVAAAGNMRVSTSLIVVP